ncbi:MAG: hypothetical protein GDA36_11340, partial [Rhodobacteraceae bacterium]|nr:hypothetical protein [Paracoccaceae bacterium]
MRLGGVQGWFVWTCFGAVRVERSSDWRRRRSTRIDALMDWRWCSPTCKRG